MASPPIQNRRRPRVRQSVGRLLRKGWIGWDLALVLTGYGLVFGLAALAFFGLGDSGGGSGTPPVPAWSAPDPGHWLGRDAWGGDLLARTLRSAGASLGFALAATVPGCLIGLAMAAFMALTVRDRGYRVLSGLAEMVSGTPAILLVLILMSGWGTGFWKGVALFGISLALPVAGRAGRWFYDLEIEGEVIAARGLGASRLRLLRENLLPRLWPRTAVLAAAFLPAVLLAEAALGYSGFGPVKAVPGLGGLVAEGRPALFEAPWLVWGPGAVLWGLALVLAMLAWVVRRMTAQPIPDPVF